MKHSEQQKQQKNPTRQYVIFAKFIICLATIFLVGCQKHGQYGTVRGVSYIASRGEPIAHGILWSPVNLDIVLFTHNSLNYHDPQIYLRNIENSEKSILVTSPEGVLEASAWSPDGNQVMIVADSGTIGFEQGGLWLLSISDESLTYFSSGDFAAWSPNNEMLLYIENDPGYNDNQPSKAIFHFVDLNHGNEETIYTIENKGTVGRASWAPDSNRIVFNLGEFTDRENVRDDLYVLDISKLQVSKITQDSGLHRYPIWSPTGNIIAYMKDVYNDSPAKMYLSFISPDGACQKSISEIDYFADLTWLPDGQNVAIIGPDGIYNININDYFGFDIYQNLCE